MRKGSQRRRCAASRLAFASGYLPQIVEQFVDGSVKLSAIRYAEDAFQW